jgi:hypothetical protein
MGKNPLRSICQSQLDPDTIIVADSVGTITKVSVSRGLNCARKDLRAKGDPDHPRNRHHDKRMAKQHSTTGAFNGVFKGAEGSVRQVVTYNNWVVGVGLDRFVRVWDINTLKLRAKWFVKQRCNAVTVFQDEQDAVTNDATVWDDLEKLSGEAKKKSLKRKSDVAECSSDELSQNQEASEDKISKRICTK